MFALLRRIATSVLIALIVAIASVSLVISLTNQRGRRDYVGFASSLGLRYVVRTLARTPPDARAATLREIARDMSAPMSLERSEGAVTDPMVPAVRRNESGPPTLLYRLDAHEVLVVRPPPRTQSSPLPFVAALALLGFTVVAVVVASALVGIPLVRRLRTITGAAESLSRANFDVVIDGPRGDAVGAVADALERTAARLRRLFSERQELLQAVSHELGTPLSRMRFHLESLEFEPDANKRRALVASLGEEVDELDELSTELISWVDADAARIEVRPLSVHEPLSQLVEEAGLSTDRDVRVELSCEPSVRVKVEPRQFIRAIENLLRNAVRHAEHAVLVRVAREDGCVLVSVEDDGPGIDPSQRERVFDPFVRLDAARARALGGTGLGLAIVRRIVARHDGTATIESAPLGGAAVQTRWPAAE